jgi:hypothetical protein
MFERRLAVGRIEVTHHHVGPPHQQLAVLRQLELDAGKRDTERVVPVPVRRSHRGAAGGLAHPEPAEQLDSLAMEELEDLGVEVASRRQPPREASTRHLPGGLEQLIVRRIEWIGPLRNGVVQLHPFAGHADEHRGAVPRHAVGERSHGRVEQEAVLRPPEHAPQHLEVAAERVEQGQITQEDVPLADLGQGHTAGKPLEHQVTVGVLDALGHTGGARCVHHSGSITDAHTLAALLHRCSRHSAR